MATAATTASELSQWPFLVTFQDLTTIEPDQPMDLSHGGPTGASVTWVTHEVRVAPTSKDVIDVRHIAASDSTSNDTARIEVSTPDGGDLTGATVRVFYWFIPQGAGGISSSTAQTA
jgi:hypothetical protein